MVRWTILTELHIDHVDPECPDLFAQHVRHELSSGLGASAMHLSPRSRHTHLAGPVCRLPRHPERRLHTPDIDHHRPCPPCRAVDQQGRERLHHVQQPEDVDVENLPEGVRVRVEDTGDATDRSLAPSAMPTHGADRTRTLLTSRSSRPAFALTSANALSMDSLDAIFSSRTCWRQLKLAQRQTHATYIASFFL